MCSWKSPGFLSAGLLIAGASLLLAVSGCSRDHAGPAGLDEADGANWPSYGRGYDENFASPLKDITPETIGRLGLLWSMDLPDVHNGGVTPLAVGGTLYFSVDQSIVRAVDAQTGKELWKHDPEVAKVAGEKLRYGWGPRGIAYWDDKIYVGTTDGRLIALDAMTGNEVWNTQTTEGADDGRYISGPPKVFDGLVIIGHGGADYAPVRGYVTAYNAQTGKQVWRFYTVPGNPTHGFENDAMEMAAKTWKGEWWKYGGGGTAWNAMTYDPKYDTIYIGTGNGAPWNQDIRSPGGGDNLFLSSIVALDARTGKYRWHYQVNPGENWDYNAAMDMALATVTIDGKPRDVLMQAPKDGFFRVIDRVTGKLISAEKFAKVTWADRIDLATGRPVERPEARYGSRSTVIWPGSSGAHGWQPMAYNAQAGLAYIPVMEMAGFYDATGLDTKHWKFIKGQANVGLNPFVGKADAAGTSSRLVAWDPIAQKEIWSQPTPGVWNGGVMTTAAGLVFQGQADGKFNAYAAASGKPLWSFDAKMGITGAPITFRAGEKQMIAVVAGWGGAGAAYLGPIASPHGWQLRRGVQRLLVFSLDAKGSLPPTPAPEAAKPLASDERADAEMAGRGVALFVRTCSICHGINATASGHAPDLRASPVPLDKENFRQVVQEGLLVERGMPKYGELSAAEIEELRQYIRLMAEQSR